MEGDVEKITLLGSNVKIRNLPVKEVSLLQEGSLPAYGYNPGDHIELLAGKVSVEYGRLDQCLTWLTAFLVETEMTPRINMVSYGEQKDIFQIFRRFELQKQQREDHGWFMVNQFLPASGRARDAKPFIFDKTRRGQFCDNNGLIIIDDSGHPPYLSEEDLCHNADVWCLAMGISAAHWRWWAEKLGERFTLLCRLSDIETTRMEMDASVNWETIVAMCIRALCSDEVGIWDENRKRFRCHIIVEMFPHGILYIGPEYMFFRFRQGYLPEKSSPRHKGSVPCYDTLVVAMLAIDMLRCGRFPINANYFYDFSKRVLVNWDDLYRHGYCFDDTLEFPDLKGSYREHPSEYPSSQLKSRTDPSFFQLPPLTAEFNKVLDLVSSQSWSNEKKKALRRFFNYHPPSVLSVFEGAEESDSYLDVILTVLQNLKEEVNRKSGFKNLPIFSIGHLRSTDPAEIDPVITLQNVMDSYVSKESVQRPLCIGVFGPPGSGKSFAVKEVARVISHKYQDNPFTFFEFNLTQFETPEEINSAIEPVRASVARGKIPVVFWDEFDCRYNDDEFGYLRYFLPAMQDGVTYVNGIPHSIGRAIFVFAGGVKASWEDMEAILDPEQPEDSALMKTLKIPDFMSRLRVVLDIDGIDLDEILLNDSVNGDDLDELRRILLKRSFIIAHQMETHWKKAARKTSGLLLRLLLGRYKYGARSIEAVIEASRAADRIVYGLPELIAPSAARIHASWRVELERRVDQLRKKYGNRAVW